MKIRWRFGIIAGVVLAMFSLYPQARLMYQRGGEWNGHFAYSDVDEAAYAAYLNALIEGRPRKNDPYTGRDDSPDKPTPESLFSIQFASPYVIAIPARLVGMSAGWAMTIAGAVAAFLTGLALFWMVAVVTGDSLFAMAASLAVIGFGTLAAGEGAVREILFGEISYPFLPGFRRYVPAMAMPAFFAMIGLIWKIFAHETHGMREKEKIGQISPASAAPRLSVAVSIFFAVLAFGFTVFSYFYVWTAAAAFLVCLAVIWLAVRPDEWKTSALRLAVVAGGCLLMLVPYAWMLSRRDSSMDSFQLAVHTRSPDLFRFPEIVAAVAGLLLIAAAFDGKRAILKGPAALLVWSLIFSVLLVFNQQVITGTSLQPIHYQVFVGNYAAALALILAVWVLADSAELTTKKHWRAVTLGLVGAAVVWGAVECYYNASPLDETNNMLDVELPLAHRLRQVAANEPALAKSTVLAFDLLLADAIPGVAPQNVLWARHQAVFGALTKAESERRFFLYLYYLRINGRTLDRLLRTDMVTITALFGWDRHTDRLSVGARPLTEAEIWTAVSSYETFSRNFGPADAADPRIDLLAVPVGEFIELDNLTKWYDLGEGELVGGNTLYRPKLRG